MTNSVATTIIAIMGVVAIFLFTFGIPWHANFFQDFNVAKDSVMQFATPISVIGDALRSTYGQAVEAKIFVDNYEFWQGKISQWAYNCGLRNPHEMSVAECSDIFTQFDEYVKKAFGDDVDKARQFVIECSKYVYFVVYKDAFSGEYFFTYTFTTRPGNNVYGSLFGEKPALSWLFQYIDNYSWWDLQKCFVGYSNGVDDTAVAYREIDIVKDGKTMDFYVMTPPKSIHGHSMMDMQIVELIPLSYREFRNRVGTAYPDVSLDKRVITSASLRY